MYEEYSRIWSFTVATEQILIDAHPHIGTNKLPQLVTEY